MARHKWTAKASGYGCASCGMTQTFKTLKSKKSKTGYRSITMYKPKGGVKFESKQTPECDSNIVREKAARAAEKAETKRLKAKSSTMAKARTKAAKKPRKRAAA